MGLACHYHNDERHIVYRVRYERPRRDTGYVEPSRADKHADDCPYVSPHAGYDDCAYACSDVRRRDFLDERQANPGFVCQFKFWRIRAALPIVAGQSGYCVV